MYLLGDLHGSYKRLLDFKRGNIIQVGDFGMIGKLHEEEKSLDYYNPILAGRGVHAYVIRGNHDNPMYWDGRYEGRWSNITLVPDYTVLALEGRKILCIGGAISVDRSQLIEGRNWWKEEEFDYNEEGLMAVLNSHDRIDVVVTHTCPEFCKPRSGSHSDLIDHHSIFDKHLKLELAAERQLMSRAYELIKPHGLTEWYYGHYHFNWDETIEHVRFRLLGIGEDIKI